MKNGFLPQKGDWVIILFLTLICISFFYLFGTYKSNASKNYSLSDSIRKSKDYVGPPAHLNRSSVKKYQKRVVVDLNSVDSLGLIKIPGIGPAFAHRILSLRKLLGGYYTVQQLQEVYGMDEDKYLVIKRWFTIKTPQKTYRLDSLDADNIPNHIYLSYKQKNAFIRLICRYGKIKNWKQLMSEPEFSHDDSVRLSQYFVDKSFEQ